MIDDTSDPLSDRFGPLARTMLHDTALAPIWRVAFLANFFTGPIYAALLEAFGLSRPAFVLLYSLSQRDGLMARDVARLSGLPKNSISRAVADVVGRKLVEPVEDSFDRRAKPLVLTAEGRALLSDIVPLFAARQEAMLAALSPSERKSLLTLLDKMVGAMPAWVDVAVPAMTE